MELTNNLLNSSKEPTVFGGFLLNQSRDSPFKGGWKVPTHYLIQNPLKVHCGLEGSNVITWVMRPIIQIQRGHLDLGRQGMTIDGRYERGISSMN